MTQHHLKNVIRGGVLGLSTLLIVGSTGGVALAHGGPGHDKHQGWGWGHHKTSSQRSNKEFGTSHKEHNKPEETQTDPAASCEVRQANVNEQIANKKAKSTNHLDWLNQLYAFMKNHVETNNIQITNYAELTAAADQAQANSGTSVANLTAPTIDCAQPASNDQELVKAAKSPVRESLMAYRASLIEIAKAVWNS